MVGFYLIIRKLLRCVLLLVTRMVVVLITSLPLALVFFNPLFAIQIHWVLALIRCKISIWGVSTQLPNWCIWRNFRTQLVWMLILSPEQFSVVLKQLFSWALHLPFYLLFDLLVFTWGRGFHVEPFQISLGFVTIQILAAGAQDAGFVICGCFWEVRHVVVLQLFSVNLTLSTKVGRTLCVYTCWGFVCWVIHWLIIYIVCANLLERFLNRFGSAFASHS